MWGRDHLKAIKADEVGLVGVILHEAQSTALLLGPVLSSRWQRLVQLDNCGGQRLGGETGFSGIWSGAARGSRSQT